MYEELGSINDSVTLSPSETLESAAALLGQLGYEISQRADTSVTGIRRKREGMFGHSLQNLTVEVLPRPEGGVKVELRGNDREGVQERQDEWTKWADSLPKLGQEHEQAQAAPGAAEPQTAKTRAEEPVGKSRERSGTRSGLPEGNREGEASGHARGPKMQEAANGGKDEPRRPAEPGRWATVASWHQEQRVAPGKQEAEPSPTQESPSSRDTKFSVDEDEGRDDAANDPSIQKVVEAESFRLVNNKGETRAVLGLSHDSPYLELKGKDRDYRFVFQVDSEDGLPKFVMFDNLGADAVSRETVQASATLGTSMGPSAPVTDTPAKRGYTVGDTATLNTGDTLTLHSYKAPVPPPTSYDKPKAGYEFLVLDVEVCASSDSEGLEYINPFDFVLQMPDNTRLKPEELHAERELEHIDLLPDDPVRGLIYFQTPKVEKPKAVIFSQMAVSGVNTVKWAV
jgi:hypothetical protein